MRVITKKAQKKNKPMKKEAASEEREEVKVRRPGSKLKYAVGLSMFMVLTIGTIIGGIGGVVLSKAFLTPQVTQEAIASNQVEVLGAAIQKSNSKAQEEENKKEVDKELVEEESLEEISLDEKSEKTITVKDTPTGFLNVRKTPGGEEIAKVYPGDTFPMSEEKNGWFNITLLDESTGWVSGKYVTDNSLNSTN